MSHPARKPDPSAPPPEPEARWVEFQRRLAEMGVHVALPVRDPDWRLPDPLPISADEASAMVVELRRSGKL